ncbi:MAG TPA: xanthine dehydrogenase family protein subunit M [Acidimicrobiales bacterium]|nr:xanthine dehydrogenase family protein subunit M [Acidimicrobiales bacterium]
MKSPLFTYVRAASTEEALEALERSDGEARVLAGGQSLLPLLAFRLARPTVLVDVNPIRELDYLRVDGRDEPLVIGALCRQARLERNDALAGPWQALREAVSLIGHLPIRVRGTVGGSIAHADPAAELSLLCVALDAEIVSVLSSHVRRSTPASTFFRGPFQTSLEPNELLVEVRFPLPPDGTRTVFEEFSDRAGDFALASVCAGVALEDGRCTWARVALGGVAPAPLRIPSAEDVLSGSSLEDEAIEEAAARASQSCQPGNDFHASSEFRRELAGELTRCALRRLARTS